MRTFFADTFYFLALLNIKDAQHDRAKRFSTGLRVRVVTTDWVLTELADAMSSIRRRAGFATVLNLLVEDPDVTIVPANDSTWNAGAALFGDRLDKEGSLTDWSFRPMGSARTARPFRSFSGTTSTLHRLSKPTATRLKPEPRPVTPPAK